MPSSGIWINLILLCIAEIFGDFQLKFFARGDQLVNLGGGIAGYLGVVYFAIKCFKSANVLFINGVWDGMSAILESIAAFVILGERLSDWKQYLGLLLIIAGIFTFRIGKIPYE